MPSPRVPFGLPFNGSVHLRWSASGLNARRYQSSVATRTSRLAQSFGSAKRYVLVSVAPAWMRVSNSLIASVKSTFSTRFSSTSTRAKPLPGRPAKFRSSLVPAPPQLGTRGPPPASAPCCASTVPSFVVGVTTRIRFRIVTPVGTSWPAPEFVTSTRTVKTPSSTREWAWSVTALRSISGVVPGNSCERTWLPSRVNGTRLQKWSRPLGGMWQSWHWMPRAAYELAAHSLYVVCDGGPS